MVRYGTSNGGRVAGGKAVCPAAVFARRRATGLGHGAPQSVGPPHWPRRVIRSPHARRLLVALCVLCAACPFWPCLGALTRSAAAAEAKPDSAATSLDRPLLDESLQLGRRFMLASQLDDGTFRYHVHFRTGETAPEQNVVRQAGALWGLALIHQDQPSAETRAALLKGLGFFDRCSRMAGGEQRFIEYPGGLDGRAGAVALISLALIDFLRAEPPDQHVAWQRRRDEYLNFLLSLRRADHHFHQSYLPGSGEGWGQGSPYYDGEILLALVKAARYAGREELRQQCLLSAEAMYDRYMRQAVEQRVDAGAAKGFYQWGSMALLELAHSSWGESERYARRTIDMAHWMIDVHRVLERRRNTAYAFEGILCAWQLARELDDDAAAQKFRGAIERGLGRLTSWQVAGPRPSAYLRAAGPPHPTCRGGVLSADQHPWLRIDTTQHQMHAVILARRYIWN